MKYGSLSFFILPRGFFGLPAAITAAGEETDFRICRTVFSVFVYLNGFRQEIPLSVVRNFRSSSCFFRNYPTQAHCTEGKKRDRKITQAKQNRTQYTGFGNPRPYAEPVKKNDRSVAKR